MISIFTYALCLSEVLKIRQIVPQGVKPLTKEIPGLSLPHKVLL